MDALGLEQSPLELMAYKFPDLEQALRDDLSTPTLGRTVEKMILLSFDQSALERLGQIEESYPAKLVEFDGSDRWARAWFYKEVAATLAALSWDKA